MVVINQNNNFNYEEYSSPEVSIDSNLKRWFSRNIGLWKSNRTYFLEEEKKKTYNLCMYINIEPIENKKDLVEVPKTILDSMEIIPVKNVDEVLKVALIKPLKRVEWVNVDQISNKEKEKKELSTH